jgi:hypothetical protein
VSKLPERGLRCQGLRRRMERTEKKRLNLSKDAMSRVCRPTLPRKNEESPDPETWHIKMAGHYPKASPNIDIGVSPPCSLVFCVYLKVRDNGPEAYKLPDYCNARLARTKRTRVLGFRVKHETKKRVASNSCLSKGRQDLDQIDMQDR